MLRKVNRVLKSQNGFTLIELMTVLIILGIILAIGVPRYLQVQAKAEWEADVSTIRNIAKAAETYASSINKFDKEVSIGQLIGAGLVDENIVLNRRRETDSSYKSVKNKGAEGEVKITKYSDKIKFSFSPESGVVTNLGHNIREMIGDPPYGTPPEFPEDTVDVNWDVK